MKGRYLILGLCILSFSIRAISATWSIVYPKSDVEQDKRDEYPVALLTLALKETGVNFDVAPSGTALSKSKALRQLAANREINVAWSMTGGQREKDLLPIRIPIYKGLIGWRIFLIKRENRGNFRQVRSFSDLVQMSPVQGHDWPDTKILQANDFEVVTALNYDKLFNMLNDGNADFFPRSVVEIWDEVNMHDFESPLDIEQSIGIKYPAAVYFFVNKKSTTLARLLETGLESAIKSGKYDELFMSVHASIIEKANIKNRRFFTLTNPVLPEKTPVMRKELWFDTEPE